jgi:hypothetical protein
MAGYDNSVVTSVRRKTSGGFETPVYLGSEQRFVKALLNSHNNNLEEQFLLGIDCLKVEWEDNSIKYITKHFYDGQNSGTGYYILFSADYTDSLVGADFYFDNDILYMPTESEGMYRVVEYPASTDPLSFVGDDAEMYQYDSSGEILLINPSFRTIRRDVLCFRTDITSTSDTQIASDILISEKLTSLKYSADGVKKTTREVITNYL